MRGVRRQMFRVSIITRASTKALNCDCAKMNTFAICTRELIEDKLMLTVVTEPLLNAPKAIEEQISGLGRKVVHLARNDTRARFMTTPGIGPITALCYLAAINDPARFRKSRNVGAYLGLTTRRYASGETDWTGRISKCGDALLSSYLKRRQPEQGLLPGWPCSWEDRPQCGFRLVYTAQHPKLRIVVLPPRLVACDSIAPDLESTPIRSDSGNSAYAASYKTPYSHSFVAGAAGRMC